MKILAICLITKYIKYDGLTMFRQLNILHSVDGGHWILPRFQDLTANVRLGRGPNCIKTVVYYRLLNMPEELF